MSDYNSYNIDTVYVTNKNQQLLAVFNKDDEDTLINPRITEIQNQEATFTFSIPLKSKKWKQIFDPENLYIVDNKIFSANFEGSFIETISEDDEQLIEVQAYEIEKLLSRKYVRAWNSETGFEKIDTFMCVILSNGNLPLKNNGTIVNTKYDKGTSGYVLDALLYGTGWKTGICDVEGTFDFETDQVDIYNNILKVQEIWGGILVFDSINKTVSLNTLSRVWQVLVASVPEMQAASNQKQCFDMLIVRCVHIADMPSVAEILKKQPDSKPTEKPAPQIHANTVNTDNRQKTLVIQSAADLANALQSSKEILMYSYYSSNIEVADFSDGEIKYFDRQNNTEFVQKLSIWLQDKTGRTWKLTRVEQSPHAQTITEQKKQELESDPMIASAMDMFADAQIIDVKQQ